MKDSLTRFSSRVANYIKYRPGYPPAVVETLRAECGLSPESVIADVGAGTGLLAREFLALGCRVYGVEPNAEMRSAGQRLLAEFPTYSAHDGTAEATGLPAASVDFVTAGQAFHWFDPPKARQEFRRILRPAGWVVLVWNSRRLDTTPFLRDYEAMLRAHGTDYGQVAQRYVEEDPGSIPGFFNGAYRVAAFDNQQVFDYAGLEGRLLSSSYAPEPGHPDHLPMLAELRRIFDRHQQGGVVIFEYDTRMYYGRLDGAGQTG
jgi:SAM-dependent methyltransferase